MTLEVIDGAAAVFPKHAARMRIVDHHDRAVFFGERRQLGDAAEIAVHREHAVGDQDLLLGGGQLLDDLASRVDVLVREHLDRRLAQPRAVDDAGVIQLVGNDHVLFGEDGGHGAGIGREAALEHHHGFDVLEFREPLFELHVHGHGSRDGANRAGADAVVLDGVERGLHQLRMRRETEIVVRREIDDRLVVEGRVGFRLAFEDAEPAIKALLLQRVEFGRRNARGIFSHKSKVES